MKLILTEEQLNLLLQTEGVARLLQESFGDSKNTEKLKKIVLKLLATGIAATARWLVSSRRLRSSFEV